MATFDYKKLTLEQMVDYVIDNDKTDKIDLNSFMEEKNEYELVSVYEADGKPKMYVGKDGKTRIKKQQKSTGKKVMRYNFLKAKKAFYKAFELDIEWINPPVSTKTEKPKKATDILAKLNKKK